MVYKIATYILMYIDYIIQSFIVYGQHAEKVTTNEKSSTLFIIGLVNDEITAKRTRNITVTS